MRDKMETKPDAKDKKYKNQFIELVIRIILIISITDAIEFYVIWKRKLALTIPLVTAIIIITIIPMIITLWWVLIVKYKWKQI